MVCTFNARLVSSIVKGSTKLKQFNVSTCQALVQTQRGPEKAPALSVIIAHLWALKVIANFGVSKFTKSRVASCHCFATCPCFALQLLSWSVHREKCPNLSTVHRFHSAGTSVSMFTINIDNCLFLCPCFPVITSGLCLYRGCSPSPDPSSASSAFILWWTVGSMVSRIPILQTGTVVVILKQRLASFQHLRSSSL